MAWLKSASLGIPLLSFFSLFPSVSSFFLRLSRLSSFPLNHYCCCYCCYCSCPSSLRYQLCFFANGLHEIFAYVCENQLSWVRFKTENLPVSLIQPTGKIEFYITINNRTVTYSAVRLRGVVGRSCKRSAYRRVSLIIRLWCHTQTFRGRICGTLQLALGLNLWGRLHLVINDREFGTCKIHNLSSTISFSKWLVLRNQRKNSPPKVNLMELCAS